MRVDADDFARPCSCGREHQIAVKEILIEAGAVEKLEEEMSEGMLREYISPLVICDTNTYAATEELMEDIYDRCQVLVLDAEGLQADRHAIKIVENNMEEDIDLILAVGAGTIHDISRYIAHNYKVPFISVNVFTTFIPCKGLARLILVISLSLLKIKLEKFVRAIFMLLIPRPVTLLASPTVRYSLISFSPP